MEGNHQNILLQGCLTLTLLRFSGFSCSAKSKQFICSLIGYGIASGSDLLNRQHFFLSIFLGLALFNIPSYYGINNIIIMLPDVENNNNDYEEFCTV